ncbi:DUF5301 domain-containing protein [Desulfosporosinus sp. SYSU MS00001]|uniref:DUF5301 domain-containing protein n=1 Tax=Desulfosporosinus sp. SYSU MS00001 TaxID=3416284 RepID=UPI003CEAFB80
MKKREKRIVGGNPLDFQRPGAWVLFISALAVILLSVCLLTNPEVYPESAPKLELPDATSVLSMKMEQIREGTSAGRTTVTDSEDIKTVLSALSGAQKTPTQSVNDYPGLENYLVVRLVLEKEEKTLCLYTHGNEYYVEEPYIGIYKYMSDKETNAGIYKIYNDRLSGVTSSLEPLRKFLGHADVNRDGLKESFYLDQSQRDNGFVTLHIDDSSGNDIWSEQAGTSHAGWTSLFLCEQGEEDYLLRYLPGMWQGYCTYTRYSWLDATPELYADGDDLKTRLVKYSEYAVLNHR